LIELVGETVAEEEVGRGDAAAEEATAREAAGRPGGGELGRAARHEICMTDLNLLVK